MDEIYVAKRDFKTTYRKFKIGDVVGPADCDPTLDFEALKTKGWIAVREPEATPATEPAPARVKR